jgi:hypothetical protein
LIIAGCFGATALVVDSGFGAAGLMINRRFRLMLVG